MRAQRGRVLRIKRRCLRRARCTPIIADCRLQYVLFLYSRADAITAPHQRLEPTRYTGTGPVSGIGYLEPLSATQSFETDQAANEMSASL